MKLIEALQIVQRPADDGVRPFRVRLATAFTPLHLRSFVAAHLRNALHGRSVDVSIGEYGDMVGSLREEALRDHDALAIVLEWADLDPRLGVRRLGGWSPSLFDDIVATSRSFLARLRAAIHAVAPLPVSIALPSTPFPMIAFHPNAQWGHLRAAIELALVEFAEEITRVPSHRLVSRDTLDQRSPLHERFDIAAELKSGYPYKNAHADVLAELLASTLVPAPPKKGLITDLDNTLWAGIVGEIGIPNVAWTLDSDAPLHGLYQQLLSALADTGVLIAVASKNELATVDAALDRPDLLLKKQQIFPIAAGWGAKSEAISSILKSWNIDADSVVFVDDSPLELEEVKTRHPYMECFQFNAKDVPGTWKLLERLRDLFGKSVLSNEDALRRESLRTNAAFSQLSTDSASSDEFLAQIQPMVEFCFYRDSVDGRVRELVNKTNQFNLNGRRLTDADWNDHIRRPGSFLVAVNYRDKFGPLGTIAVLWGTADKLRATLNGWVMSCRAFSRRIEHRSLRKLFEALAVNEIGFDFAPTPKNGPLQQFLREIIGADPLSACCLTLQTFEQRCPAVIPQAMEATA
jgi:FkbH-like protein